MKVAVIGAGNSGCAHTVKLIENGHIVNLIKTSNVMHNESFDKIMKTGEIACVDSTNNNREFSVRPNLITTSIKEGLDGVDVVMVLTQSLQHRDLAPRIAPYLSTGQIVFIIPGNLASISFMKFVKEPGVIFVEAESTPYDARLESPGNVHILFKNARNAVSFLNNENKDKISIINSLFGLHKYVRKNIIESMLHNPNMVVHTIGAIMSASRIEYAKGEFWMYREAFSPAIWNLIEQLDKEKNSIIEKCGGTPMSYLDACKWRNEQDLTQDSLTVFKNYAESGGPKGPDSLNTRFIYEDVPMELCALENLGKLLDIKTPITSSLINIASALKKTNYRNIAYSIDEISMIMPYI